MVVVALSKMRGASIDEVLMSLLQDDQVYGHAIMALGKRRVAEAALLIKGFELDPKPWIRKEAAKALRLIEKRR
jgi:hypothetical protein